MGSEHDVPDKPEVPVKALVAAIAEDVLDAGWRPLSHTERTDHERGERRLTVVLVKTSTEQGVLQLREGGKGKEPDEE